MTKRNNIFQENVSKKLRLEGTNIEALWGEDLNPDEVEDCFLLATQAYEQKNQNKPGPIQRNNVSVLPNYSFFQQNDIFTSTQCNNNKPTTSSTLNDQKSTQISPENLQIQLNKVNADLVIKEGEITILRDQLKQVRLNLTSDHQKKEKEWIEKIQVLDKELISTKTELDFKKLEVLNLKHKISEVKHGDVTLNGILNFSQCGENKKIVEVGLKLNNLTGEFLEYPLRDKIDGNVFNLSNIECFYDFNLNLNKFNVQDEQKVHEQYKASKEYNQFKFEDLFSSISILLNCNKDDLKSDNYKEIIDKIFGASLQLMKSFLKNMNILEQDVQEETIRQRDCVYLDLKQGQLCKNSSIFGEKEWYKNEIGIKCRRIIAVLSEILPYSSHLRKLIFHRSIQTEDFFALIKSTIKIIGVLRISEKCTGFLSSIVLLMTKISFTSEFTDLHPTVKEIITEIIFTRPTIKTLEYICGFLKQSALNKDFIHNLCRRTSQRSYSRSSEQLILNCNEESCLLTIFALIYKERFSKNEELQNASVLDLLKFLTKLFDYNVEWMYSNNDCNCLRKTIEVGVHIIYKTTKSFLVELEKTSNQEYLEEYKEILKLSINVLHLIKSVDSFDKLSIVCQYKFILETLTDYSDELDLKDKEGSNLKELNHHEEKKNIDESILNKIPIWK